MKFFCIPKSEIITRLKHDFPTAPIGIYLDLAERLMEGSKSLYLQYTGDYPIIEEFLEVISTCDNLNFTNCYVESSIEKGYYFEILPMSMDDAAGFWSTAIFEAVDATTCITEKQFVGLMNPIIKYII